MTGTIDHGDHEHSVEEVFGLMGARIQRLQHQLEISQIHISAMKLALAKLLPNIGDSVTVEALGEIHLDDGSVAKTVTFFRDDGNDLDMKAD